MLSLISKSLTSPKKPHKRASISNSNHISPTNSSRKTYRDSITSVDNNKLISEFDDTEIVKDTPLSILIRKIRQLEQLTVEDILFIKIYQNTFSICSYSFLLLFLLYYFKYINIGFILIRTSFSFSIFS